MSSNGGQQGGGFMGRLWGGGSAATAGSDQQPAPQTQTSTSQPQQPQQTQQRRTQRPTSTVPPNAGNIASQSQTQQQQQQQQQQQRRDFSSRSEETPSSASQTSSGRPVRQRPPSTYGGAPSPPADASSPSSVNPNPRRERPERPERENSLNNNTANDAQTNKERDIARRHQYRQEQLRLLREREESEDPNTFAKTGTRVMVTEAPIAVVVIPGYGNDDDYVLEYLSGSASESDNEYRVEEYSSNGAQKQKRRRPQKITTFSPNHREVPVRPAMRKTNRKRNSGGGAATLRNRISFDGAAKGSGNGRVPSGRPVSTAPPRAARPGPNSRTSGGRGAGAAEGSSNEGYDEGEAGWDDVYEPASPTSEAGKLSRSPSNAARAARRPNGATGADPSKQTPPRINSTGSSSSIEDDVASSSLMNDIMGALGSPKDDDKMPDDREARREWLKRRQQMRNNQTTAESPPAKTPPDAAATSSLTVQTKELTEREQRRQDWLKRKQAGNDEKTSPSSSSLESPVNPGNAPVSTTRSATDAEIMQSLSPNSRLSSSGLPTEFVLALDAEKTESNRLRQLLAAKENELSKLKLENRSEIKRVSLLNMSTNNEQINQLEVTNEELKSKVSEMEFQVQQVQLELESNKAALENEIKYRSQEREQAKQQVSNLSAERDKALKEAAGKSVVLGSTEMIVNQTTKELAALKSRERELTTQLEEQNGVVRSQTQALAEADEKLKRAMTEVQNRSALVRNTEERLRGLIKEMGNARAREADLMRKLQEGEARMQDTVSSFEEFKNVSAENLYNAKQVEDALRIETRDLANQLQQAIHGSRLRDDEIKKNRELIQGMAGRIGAMDRDLGNAKNVMNERDQKIGQMSRDLTVYAQKEKDLVSQINLLKQSHGGEMASALEIAQNHQRDLEKLRAESSDLSMKLATATSTIGTLESAKQNLEDTVFSLNNRVASLDGELGIAQALADETVIKIRNLTDEITKAAARERKLMDDQKQMQTRFMELDSIAQRLVADRDGWRGRATELEKLLDQNRKESSENAIIKENLEKDLRNEIANQQTLLANAVADGTKVALGLKDVISGLETNLASMKQRSDEFEGKGVQLGMKLAAAIQNEKYLAEQIQVLKEARGGDQAAALDRMEKHQQELQQIANERNVLQQRLAELETVLQHLVSDRDGWKSRAEELQHAFEQTVNEHEKSMSALRSSMDETVALLSNKLATLENEKSLLDQRNATRIGQLEAELAAANALRLTLEGEIAQLKTQLFAALNNDHEATVSELKKIIKSGEDAQASLKADIADLFETVKAKDREKEDLQANINELEETIDELMIEQESHEKKVMKLQASLKKAKAELVDIERTTDASITHLRDETAFGIKRAQDEANRMYWNVRMAVNALVAAIMQTDNRNESEEMSSNNLVDLDGIYDDLKACRQRALEWIVQIGVAGNEAEAAAQNLNVAKNQIASLQKQLSESKRELDQLTSQVDQIKDSDTRQKQQIKILEQQAEKLTKQKNDAEKRATSNSTESEEIILALQQEIISIRGELAKKSEILKRSTPAEIQELLKTGETELTDARNAASAAEKELRALQRSIQEYEGLITKLQADFESLEKQFTDSQAQALKESDASKEQIEALKGQVAVERESLMEAQEAIINCQNMIRDLETLRNEMIQKFERQLDEKDAAFSKSVADLEASNAEVEELKYDLEDLEAKLANATSSAETLESNYQSVKDEIELLRNQRRESVEAMQSMIQSLQIRLQEEQDFMENSQKEWTQERDDQLEQISTLQASIQEKENLVQKLTASSIDSSEEVQNALKEISHLKQQLEEREKAFSESLAQANAALKAAEADIERLKTELAALLEAQAAQKAAFEAEVAELKAAKGSIEAQLADVQEKLARQLETLSEQAQKDLAGATDLESTVAVLTSQKQIIEQETAALRASSQELEAKLKDVLVQLEAKSLESAEMQKELQTARSTAANLEASLTDATGKLSSIGANAVPTGEVDSLKLSLSEKDARVSSLEAQLQELDQTKANLAQAAQETARLQAVVADFEAKFAEAANVRSQLEAALENVSRLEAAQVANSAVPNEGNTSQMKAEYEASQAELSAAKANVDSLEKQLQECKQASAELEKSRSELLAAQSTVDAKSPSDVDAEILRLKSELEAASTAAKELETLKAALAEHEQAQNAMKASLEQAMKDKTELAKELDQFKKRNSNESVASAVSAGKDPSFRSARNSTGDITTPLSPTTSANSEKKSLMGRLWGSK
ncbi:hypothetical protein HDU77_004559 [Chytriomyces hyalinus]|nr:hypothetical protein HDU77_004559 [Chytriomyces hyalinus]